MTALADRLARITHTHDIESPIFGAIRLREISRQEFRASYAAALDERDETIIYTERFHAGIVAVCVLDPETDKPAFADTATVMSLPHRENIWEEINRLADIVLKDLSGVGSDALKEPSAD